jgi:hypothetical protein
MQQSLSIIQASQDHRKEYPWQRDLVLSFPARTPSDVHIPTVPSTSSRVDHLQLTESSNGDAMKASRLNTLEHQIPHRLVAMSERRQQQKQQQQQQQQQRQIETHYESRNSYVSIVAKQMSSSEYSSNSCNSSTTTTVQNSHFVSSNHGSISSNSTSAVQQGSNRSIEKLSSLNQSGQSPPPQLTFGTASLPKPLNIHPDQRSAYPSSSHSTSTAGSASLLSPEVSSKFRNPASSNDVCATGNQRLPEQYHNTLAGHFREDELSTSPRRSLSNQLNQPWQSMSSETIGPYEAELMNAQRQQQKRNKQYEKSRSSETIISSPRFQVAGEVTAAAAKDSTNILATDHQQLQLRNQPRLHQMLNGRKGSVASLNTAHMQQLEHSVLNSAPYRTWATAEPMQDNQHSSSPVSLETQDHVHASRADILVQLDDDVALLRAKPDWEGTKTRGRVQAKLQTVIPKPLSTNCSDISATEFKFQAVGAVNWDSDYAASIPTLFTLSETSNVQLPNEFDEDNYLERDVSCFSPRDPDVKRKQDLVTIADFVTSMHSSEQTDGLLMLSAFLEENKHVINWDGLVFLFLEVLSFIPDTHSMLAENGSPDALLILDVACFCIGQMCSNSSVILDRARLLGAVPRIILLLNYEDAAVRNSACRALIVLTDSHAYSKFVLNTHDVTHKVLLQHIRSFDDDLKVVAMNLLARSMYGCASNIREQMFTDALLQDIAACIQALPNQALVGCSACILLCNALAGSNANVEKATSFGLFEELTAAASKENDSNSLSYLLAAMMNFTPTAALLASLSRARIPLKLPDFLSRSHSGLSHNSLQMLGWIRSAEGS